MVYHYGMESGPEDEGEKKKIKGPDAYALIRRAITSGRFVPGQRLSERELAARYGVSRTPIREALLELSYEGLVAITPRSGMAVVGITPEDAVDNFAILATLAGKAGSFPFRKSWPVISWWCGKRWKASPPGWLSSGTPRERPRRWGRPSPKPAEPTGKDNCLN